MKTALTIAGSDSSGGAGIQADLKTMTMLGVYGMSAITALTAQNTTGVFEIFEVTPKFLRAQIDAVFTDIPPDAVKIGMVSSSDLIITIAESLKHYDAKNIVVDPVMVATSGSKLIDDDAIETLKKYLLPIAKVITPNIPECAAELIHQRFGCAVLCKGGHNLNDANDILFDENGSQIFHGERIDNPNTHGTGCTLSSAIASYLAKDLSLTESISQAKKYLSGALSDMLHLGNGRGPMNHAFLLKNLGRI